MIVAIIVGCFTNLALDLERVRVKPAGRLAIVGLERPRKINQGVDPAAEGDLGQRWMRRVLSQEDRFLQSQPLDELVQGFASDGL
ncbi:MAG: hypothetical protein MOB07_19985 [Acidobacteria bacterium]|nr:hypothetical protein [Acidobacteriota bacterium]